MANEIFDNAYALLIGVNTQEDPNIPSLPAVERDVNALRDVLINPDYCGYQPDRVRVLLGENATKDNILDAMDWLVEVAEENESEPPTVLFYFSGHGHQTSGEADHHLITFDTQLGRRNRLRNTIKQSDVNALVEDINAQRLVLLMDCCQAGAADLDTDGGKVLENTHAFDPKLLMTEEKQTVTVLNEEQREALVGEGKSIPPPTGTVIKKKTSSKPIPGMETRHEVFKSDGTAVMASSQGSEKSWIREDEPELSLFTYHLIEALTGHAPAMQGATEVGVLSVMDYVSQVVPMAAAQRSEPQNQHPTFKVDGDNFPIAKLIGGRGIADGEELKAPDQLVAVPAGVMEIFNTTNNVDVNGNLNATVVGNRGDVSINQTGNQVHQQNTAIAVEGSIGAGAAVGQGAQGGNTISGTGNVVGDNNTVDNSVTTITTNGTMQERFAQVQTAVEELEMPATEKEEIKTAVAGVEAQIEATAQGAAAESGKLMMWLGKLKEAAPTILNGVADIIQDPSQAVAQGVRLIADVLRPKSS